MNDFNIAQCLMNDGNYSTDEMQDILAESEADDAAMVRRLSEDDIEIDPSPVRTAIERAAGTGFAEEIDLYTEYLELFLQSMQDEMHTEAVISPVPVEGEAEVPNYASAQGLSGGCRLVPGIIASPEAYLEFACRYSGEDLEAGDELMTDSVEEFINVVNGLFTMQLARQKMNDDLDLPHSGRDVQPKGEKQLRLRALTAFGSFEIVLAMSEFF